MIDAEAHPMLVAHAAGDSYRVIGKAHGLSHEAARQTVLREATEFLNELELSLYVALKLEKLGREAEAEWPTVVVPFGPDWSTANAVIQWVVDRLRGRDVDVHVTHKPTPDGVVFQLRIDRIGGAA